MPRGKYPRPKKLGTQTVTTRDLELQARVVGINARCSALEQENARLRDELKSARLVHAKDMASVLRVAANIAVPFELDKT